MRKLILSCFLSFACLSVHAYETPKPFMDLYFDFTGENAKNYPKGQKTIAELLIDAEEKNAEAQQVSGPLILLINSTLYIYDSQQKLIYQKLLRTNPASGFYEMTAVSHIGPAIAYLAKVKALGDDSWKAAMQRLLQNIRVTRQYTKSHAWLEQLNIAPWNSHKDQIAAMFDYALSMAGNYCISVLNGADFDLAHVQDDFLDGNQQYPIPFNNIMVATFMLTALESMDEIYTDTKGLGIDLPNAMVIIRFVAGTNVTAGLTKGTNWFVPFFQALSQQTLPSKNILIAPYAEVKSDLGQQTLSQSSYQYYKNQVWLSSENRQETASQVFTAITTIYLPGRPKIPGDYGFSKASDIQDFLMRLKHSLQDPREMLSNSVAFWMAGELADKKWQYEQVAIPGLTDGFPKGVSEYPSNNPEIGEVK